jgi:hypothetical protein
VAKSRCRCRRPNGPSDSACAKTSSVCTGC